MFFSSGMVDLDEHLCSPLRTIWYTKLQKLVLLLFFNNVKIQIPLVNDENNLHDIWILPWTLIRAHAATFTGTGARATQKIRELTKYTNKEKQKWFFFNHHV